MNIQERYEELEAELNRLKSVDLARAYQDLCIANEEKSKLIALLQQQADALERQSREDSLTGGSQSTLS